MGVRVHVLKRFIAVSDKAGDGMQARDRCESFCDKAVGCWGCSIQWERGAPNSWNAIPVCGEQKRWAGMIPGDVSEKPQAFKEVAHGRVAHRRARLALAGEVAMQQSRENI